MLKKKKSKQNTKSGESKDLKSIGGFLLKKMALGGAARLRSKADEVNKLNVFPVPDGDTGDNMRMTIESGIAAVENMDSDNIAAVMKAISKGMLLGARGNSGVILSQFFAGFSKGLEKSDKADVSVMGEALQLGVQQAYTSVMNPSEGTILTVARESVEYAVKRITPQSTIRTLFGDLVKEMYASLERTPEALAVLKEAGVVDSGGAGLFYIMDGFNRVLNGEQLGNDTRNEKSKENKNKSTEIMNPAVKVLKELQKLFNEMEHGTRKYYSPVNLIDAIQIHKERFDLKSNQHDTSDFMNLLFDCLEDATGST